MKFHFENQPHQASAVSAIADLFEGVIETPQGETHGQAAGAAGHANFSLNGSLLAENLSTLTNRAGLEHQTEIRRLREADLTEQTRSFPNFSVEMETGTGKTYVYIETALRLAELYGLRKFVVLVHSVAIRAGVVKTFEQTASHFAAKYPDLKYQWGVLGEGPSLDDFTEPSSDVQFLVVSVQAIDKPESNSIYQEAEQPQLWADTVSGITALAETCPVVVIDEPQNMATELRRKAIATLNPLFALRYSATHRERFNLVHRLGPKAASEAGLVKSVSVKGVVAGGSGQAYLHLTKMRSVKRRLMADAVIECATRSGPARTPVVLQNGSDLYDESGSLDAYRGFVVDRFERKPDRVIFENGLTVHVGEETGVDRLAIWRDQIRYTIRQHISRQAQVDASGREVKVLSLFFIERVADYVGDGAVLPPMFDNLYREEWVRSGRTESDCPNPADIRTAYFASTKTGIAKDTAGRASDAKLESRAFEEIIANKEAILVKENPRSFIFSHSALREGWDNPNVFQICFLRHTRSELERRQQIGRGLRLPVDQEGRRVADPAVCRLTLVVDEAFTEFRDALNREYAENAAPGGNNNGAAAPDVRNADDEITVRRREDKYLSSEFGDLWGRIKYKARYKVSLDGKVLPDAVAASDHLNETAYLARRANVVQEAELRYDDEGRIITADGAVAESRGEGIKLTNQLLPDPIRLIEDQLLSTKYPLQLTRPTILEIIEKLPTQVKRRSIYDPFRWARIVAATIRMVTVEEMLKHITYEPVPEADWWNAEVIFLEAEAVSPAQHGELERDRGAYPAPVGGTNLFDHAICDSGVERDFASSLENDREHVKLFTKLPRRFKVRTPVGDYSPDWAVVYENEGIQRLYLVRETKATSVLADLEWDEAMRIRFAGKHFTAAPSGPVHYAHTTAELGIRVPTDGD